MKKIILCLFLAMSFSLPELNLTYARNAAVPLTATINLDEAGLKQALENNNDINRGWNGRKESGNECSEGTCFMS